MTTNEITSRYKKIPNKIGNKVNADGKIMQDSLYHLMKEVCG